EVSGDFAISLETRSIDLPIVHPGRVRPAGVEEGQMPAPPFGSDLQPLRLRAARKEGQNMGSSLPRRIVVLDSRRLDEHAGLAVPDEADPIKIIAVASGPALESSRQRDRESGGAAQTRAEGNLRPELDLERLIDFKRFEQRGHHRRSRLGEEIGGAQA